MNINKVASFFKLITMFNQNAAPKFAYLLLFLHSKVEYISFKVYTKEYLRFIKVDNLKNWTGADKLHVYK